MKNLRAPWKCRAVENQENLNQVSLRFPPPLEIAARFPHFHRADDDVPFFNETKVKTTERSPNIHHQPDFTPSGSFLD
jgi:hypothetical protein